MKEEIQAITERLDLMEGRLLATQAFLTTVVSVLSEEGPLKDRALSKIKTETETNLRLHTERYSALPEKSQASKAFQEQLLALSSLPALQPPKSWLDGLGSGM